MAVVTTTRPASLRIVVIGRLRGRVYRRSSVIQRPVAFALVRFRLRLRLRRTRRRVAAIYSISAAFIGVAPSTRKWRNWQTHQLEGLAVAIPWGFESPLPHQTSLSIAGRR